MTQNDVGIRIAGLVTLTVAISAIVVYSTAQAAPRMPTRAVAAVPQAQNRAETHQRGGDKVLPLITAALTENEFAKARALTHQLGQQSVRDQLMEVVRSAEARTALARVADSMRYGRFGEARLLARELDGRGTQDQMMEIITFAEARAALDVSDTATAEALAGTLSGGVKRALLFTALANRYSRIGDRRRAIANARLALVAINVARAEHRRQLMATVAHVLLPIDEEQGVVVLDEALHQPVISNVPAGSVRRAGKNFYEIVRAANSQRAFSLALTGIGGDLNELVASHHARMRCLHGNSTNRSAANGGTRPES